MNIKKWLELVHIKNKYNWIETGRKACICFMLIFLLNAPVLCAAPFVGIIILAVAALATVCMISGSCFLGKIREKQLIKLLDVSDFDERDKEMAKIIFFGWERNLFIKFDFEEILHFVNEVPYAFDIEQPSSRVFPARIVDYSWLRMMEGKRPKNHSFHTVFQAKLDQPTTMLYGFAMYAKTGKALPEDLQKRIELMLDTDGDTQKAQILQNLAKTYTEYASDDYITGSTYESQNYSFNEREQVVKNFNHMRRNFDSVYNRMYPKVLKKFQREEIIRFNGAKSALNNQAICSPFENLLEYS